MSKKHPILIGTLVLTITGFITRLIGFFFRIFLSQSFGEEQVGLYQLIFPIYALCFSFTCAGIQTAISRCTARKISLGKRDEAVRLLFLGLSSSLFLSFMALLLLQKNALFLSIHVLGDLRCESMLYAISYALPFASIHSCICGYYFGLKQTKIPALSQLVEQITRVCAVYIIYQFTLNNNGSVNILFAVFGIVCGEFASASFTLFCYFRQQPKQIKLRSWKDSASMFRELFSLAIPLSSSRVLLNLLQSIESISIPMRLQQYGYGSVEALSNYGVLTGMALPCIFFPTALTNSISTMLLPSIAGIQATKDYTKLKQVFQKVFLSCLSLGFTFCIFLFFFSSFIGTNIFHSTLAGDYLKVLAWICPFLYLNATLISIINGLGNAAASFIINLISLIIRIVSIFLLIPAIGMNGYLFGLLASQLFTSIVALGYLVFYLKKRV